MQPNYPSYNARIYKATGFPLRDPVAFVCNGTGNDRRTPQFFQRDRKVDTAIFGDLIIRPLHALQGNPGSLHSALKAERPLPVVANGHFLDYQQPEFFTEFAVGYAFHSADLDKRKATEYHKHKCQTLRRRADNPLPTMGRQVIGSVLISFLFGSPMRLSQLS